MNEELNHEYSVIIIIIDSILKGGGLFSDKFLHLNNKDKNNEKKNFELKFCDGGGGGGSGKDDDA